MASGDSNGYPATARELEFERGRTYERTRVKRIAEVLAERLRRPGMSDTYVPLRKLIEELERREA